MSDTEILFNGENFRRREHVSGAGDVCTIEYEATDNPAIPRIRIEAPKLGYVGENPNVIIEASVHMSTTGSKGMDAESAGLLGFVVKQISDEAAGMTEQFRSRVLADFNRDRVAQGYAD